MNVRKPLLCDQGPRARVFQYYGGKYRLAPLYPEPRYNTIVEPFAGAAAYSLLHGAKRRVFLIDANPNVVAVWKWLIRATKAEIESLPLPGRGERVSAYGLAPEPEYLIRSYAAPGARVGDTVCGQSRWTENARQRVADSLRSIRHYDVRLGDYSSAPDVEATWFIDPPYENGGHQYKINALDRPLLAAWSGERLGQRIVCESSEQTWLSNTIPILTLRGHHKAIKTEVAQIA